MTFSLQRDASAEIALVSPDGTRPQDRTDGDSGAQHWTGTGRRYEPYRDERGCVRLRNCPFHALAEEDRDLVCHMNEQLVNGVVRGLGNDTVHVVCDPVPGGCCVRVEPPRLSDEPELADP